jgi:hypothetical protein
VPVWRQVLLGHNIFQLHFAWISVFFFLNMFEFRQSCEVQNWAWSAVVLQISYF